ncbi:MAG: DNA repair protein RecN [Thiohalomonadales bacterium]
MISLIQIRNFTIVKELTLELNPGMTVLTGETGAGKSILLDALNLTLGGRGDAKLIRHGADRAEVTVAFSLEITPDVQQWLADNELADEDNDSCIIRRIINKNSATKSFINGRPTTVQSLRDLGDMLVDIHGQHAHQSLLKRDLQRRALDDFAQLDSLARDVKSSYVRLQALQGQKTALEQQGNERDARMELLEYQVHELDQLDLQDNEVELLDSEQRQLSNITTLREAGEQVLFSLKEADDNSIISQLDTAIYTLGPAVDSDKVFASVQQQLNSAQIQIQEATEELRLHMDGLSFDHERLAWIDERLVTILDLSRKHRIEGKELQALQQRLAGELSQLRLSNQQVGQLDGEITQALQYYHTSAAKLTSKRQAAAKKLSSAVTHNLSHLGMQHGKFHVLLEPLEQPSAAGLERIEFQVSTNPGQTMGPLNKIASGGELSRISLAIQVITAGTGRIPCLVFDEVDVGIGGGTAEVVGRLLKDLSVQSQVLCITHQAQVASLAPNHLLVSKISDKKSTTSSVISLNEKQRTDEIARMIGGIDITAQTRSHAHEMLTNGRSIEAEPA